MTMENVSPEKSEGQGAVKMNDLLNGMHDGDFSIDLPRAIRKISAIGQALENMADHTNLSIDAINGYGHMLVEAAGDLGDMNKRLYGE